MEPILLGQTDNGKAERDEDDVAISGSVAGGSDRPTLDSRAPERPAYVTERRPFLEFLSGRDPLRVMRSDYDWWKR